MASAATAFTSSNMVQLLIGLVLFWIATTIIRMSLSVQLNASVNRLVTAVDSFIANQANVTPDADVQTAVTALDNESTKVEGLLTPAAKP